MLKTNIRKHQNDVIETWKSVLKKLALKLSSNIGARGKILETLSCVTGNLTHNLA